jgi:hypothetical protein
LSRAKKIFWESFSYYTPFTLRHLLSVFIFQFLSAALLNSPPEKTPSFCKVVFSPPPSRLTHEHCGKIKTPYKNPAYFFLC